jgi:integrase
MGPGVVERKIHGEMQWVIAYRDAEGKRKQISVDENKKPWTKKGALARWFEIQKELEAHGHNSRGPYTWTNLYESYMSVFGKPGKESRLAPRTKTQREQLHKSFLVERIGTLHSGQLTPRVLTELLYEKLPKVTTDSVIKRIRSTLTVVFDEAVRTHKIAANPMDRVKAPRRTVRQKIDEDEDARRRAECPTSTEVKQIFQDLSDCRRFLWVGRGGGRGGHFELLHVQPRVTDGWGIASPWARQIVATVASERGIYSGELRVGVTTRTPQHFLELIQTQALAGLRGGEARALPWENIVWGSHLKIRQAIDPELHEVGRVKTPAAVRDVPLGPWLERILKRLHIEAGEPKTGLVFAKVPDGRRPDARPHWTYPCFLFHWRQFCLRTGRLKPGTMSPLWVAHRLRHYAVTCWIADGASRKQVSKWIGHTSVAFTEDVYGHLWVEDELDRELIGRSEARLFGDCGLAAE